jgi:hypothetical protein
LFGGGGGGGAPPPQQWIQLAQAFWNKQRRGWLYNISADTAVALFRVN